MPDSSISAERGPLRGVVVGLGAMGSHHLRILASLPEVEVVATVEPDEARREDLLRSHPGVPGYAALEHALEEHGELDFACLAVPVAELSVCAELRSAPGCMCSSRSRWRRAKSARAR